MKLPKIATWDRDYDPLGLGPEVITNYSQNLEKHIAAVQRCGKLLHVPDDLLRIHDYSKWSAPEFWAYAKHFYGGGAPQLFAEAWLHHIHHNPHHWQYWIFPGGVKPYSPPGTNVFNGIMEMPEKYALEMVADWMGASEVYSGDTNMTKWLTKHSETITLHPNTSTFVKNVLQELGYNIELIFFNEGPPHYRPNNSPMETYTGQ